ncbi:hypothetical protein HHK36_030876 [Tetracentron sinense]|uniref:LOB domain-containing protein n=1 Tax=Tetracentron sinense TaxID=13715 RepID=A0A834YBV1_TETSI|nr:hypothetical protein HHK36_030876 [Tetracentron sinense]
MASSSNSGSCTTCKLMRKKCNKECVFAPYFPTNQRKKFENVHKIFGASNVSKLLKKINPEDREFVMKSVIYEAEARLEDPVYGWFGLISILEQRLEQIQFDLDHAKKQLTFYMGGPFAMLPLSQQPYNQQHHQNTFGMSSSVMSISPGPSQIIIREPQKQQQHMLDAQQLAAGEQQEMLRMQYEQQQFQNQMEMMRLHHGGQFHNPFQLVQQEPQQSQGDGSNEDRGVGLSDLKS